MMKSTMRKLTAKLCVLLATFAVPVKGNAAQIWVGATNPFRRATLHWPQDDYNDLFGATSPIGRDSLRIDVFLLSPQFILGSSDSQIANVLRFLKSRHVAVAIQAAPLLPSQDCGRGVEGYSPVAELAQTIHRVKALGGTIDYVQMDEPLWYGHEAKGSYKLPTCRTPIAQLAAEAASKMKAVRSVYPHVEIGDVEPFGAPIATRQWIDDLKQWVHAYRDAAGTPLAFLQADVVWQRPNWRPQLIGGINVARLATIPIGVIYDAAPHVNSDIEWTRSVAEHFKMIESDLRLAPSQAVFQSWTDHPRKMLPATEPGTLTNLVLQYQAWHSAAKRR